MHDRRATVYAAQKIADQIADKIVSLCGDTKFITIHIFFFSVWIVTRGFGYDKWPYGMLTLIVSLEAIFLTSFVLMAQKREDAIARKRDDLEASEVADDHQMIHDQVDMIRELRTLVYEVYAMQQALVKKSSDGEEETKDE